MGYIAELNLDNITMNSNFEKNPYFDRCPLHWPTI